MSSLTNSRLLVILGDTVKELRSVLTIIWIICLYLVKQRKWRSKSQIHLIQLFPYLKFFSTRSFIILCCQFLVYLFNCVRYMALHSVSILTARCSNVCFHFSKPNAKSNDCRFSLITLLSCLFNYTTKDWKGSSTLIIRETSIVIISILTNVLCIFNCFIGSLICRCQLIVRMTYSS
jgi:hypothetical protein